jgi:hypothetical protein
MHVPSRILGLDNAMRTVYVKYSTFNGLKQFYPSLFYQNIWIHLILCETLGLHRDILFVSFYFY